MRVQILKQILTVYGSLAKGDVLCVADAEAQSWVELGYAKQADVVEQTAPVVEAEEPEAVEAKVTVEAEVVEQTAPVKKAASRSKKGATK